MVTLKLNDNCAYDELVLVNKVIVTKQPKEFKLTNDFIQDILNKNPGVSVVDKPPKKIIKSKKKKIAKGESNGND